MNVQCLGKVPVGFFISPDIADHICKGHYVIFGQSESLNFG